MSTDGWIDKEYICIYNRILFSHKNGNSAMCHNMNGSWGHCGKWNKLDG